MKNPLLPVLAGLLLACHFASANEPGTPVPGSNPADLFVQVSPNDPHYFQLSDGSPYIPIGLNLAEPRFDPAESPEKRMDRMEGWMRSLAKNRGNFARIWLGHDFFDVEHERCGEYDEQRFQRLQRVLDLARKLGIRVKLCMEQFRRIEPVVAPKTLPDGRWNTNNVLYHVTQGGEWSDMADYLDSPSGRAHFRQKMAWYHDRIGDDPTVFAWELWNEMNAVGAPERAWMNWTETMLSDLRKQFSRNLVTQSLGSLDKPWKSEAYRWLAELRNNDIVQVHRYLDLGAELEACRGPMDEIAAGAVATMRTLGGDKPILLAETGGVQPRHAGPIELYAQDHDGILLHDTLFAAFFAGAAGPGHSWFWDSYVDANQLWYHFDRFAEAVKGIDPARERFVPQLIKNDRLRVYVLDGRQTDLFWCRDAAVTWVTELRNGVAPQPVTGASLDMFPYIAADAGVKVEFYDPWTNTWHVGRSTDRRIALPTFTRSLVVRVSRTPAL